MIALDRLREMPLFAELPAERMPWLCDNVSVVDLSENEVLINEGEPPKGFFILLEGEILVLRKSEGQDMPVGRHVPLAFFGETPLLAGTHVPVTLRTASPTRLIRLREAAFRELLGCCESFAKIIFQTMASRLAGIESFVRQREKMAALGTLSAGLAHELNNPAAAVARASGRLRTTVEELHARICALNQNKIAPDVMMALDALRRGAKLMDSSTDPLRISAAEDALTDWLEGHGVERGWQLAPALAGGSLKPADLDPIAARIQGAALTAAMGWLAATLEIASLVDESARASRRIAEIVKAMKSYSYRDQAPLQEADIHDGIEDTLTILRHKLKQGISVVREYDRGLPRVAVYGAELNQVWTNLIDNAADALQGAGTITIRTRRENDHVIVEIGDNGPGIPAEIQTRVFEPFFTTKPVGQGSGLGLDITQKIVVNRHNGSITLVSRPGDTRFEVRLPIAGHAPGTP